MHSQSRTRTGTLGSSVATIIDRSENTSSVVDQTAVAVVSQSETIRSTTTPSDTASRAGSASVNALKFKPLIEELQALIGDLEIASRQNKVVALFNSDDDVSSIESHDQSLTGIITDLTATLAIATHKETSQIRKDINEQLHANGNNTPGGLINRISRNKIQRVEGNFDANNKVYGTNARMVREVHGNEIGFIAGDAFSGNVVSTFHSE